MSVVIETTKGDITVDLYTKERPKTCLNFLKLCKQKLYNNNLFHMIENNFIAQTGDPTETGRGGDSIFYHLYGDQARYFEAESIPRIKHTKQGQLSMVNCGENMLGSQFFLTLSEDLDYLDGEHCVFGEVVEGFDIVEVLNETICDAEHRPYQDVRITHTVVLHDPFDDPTGLELRPTSPEPSKELISSSRIGADEDLNDYAGKTEEEINEIIAQKEAKARATILEMVGDLPDADCAPPENVLFVCKLNPVTNDDDLEIIFSRFGKVKCCEVIRDKKTAESLQYAFVEFEEESACESAYFKMDNVLIDDRRIHVDFSQSVAKYHWKGKGRLEVRDKGTKKHEGEKNKDLKLDHDGDKSPVETSHSNIRGKMNRSGNWDERPERETDKIENTYTKERRRSRSRDKYEKRDDKHKHRYDRKEDNKHRHGGNRDMRDESENRDRDGDKINYKNSGNIDRMDERKDNKRKDDRRNERTSEKGERKNDRQGIKKDDRDRNLYDRRDGERERHEEDGKRQDRCDERRDNRSKDDRRNERTYEKGKKMDRRGIKMDDRDRILDNRRDCDRERHVEGRKRQDERIKDGPLEKRKYFEERGGMKDREAVRKNKKKPRYYSSDTSSSESDDRRHHKKDKKRKPKYSSTDSSSSESDSEDKHMRKKQNSSSSEFSSSESDSRKKNKKANKIR